MTNGIFLSGILFSFIWFCCCSAKRMHSTCDDEWPLCASSLVFFYLVFEMQTERKRMKNINQVQYLAYFLAWRRIRMLRTQNTEQSTVRIIKIYYGQVTDEKPLEMRRPTTTAKIVENGLAVVRSFWMQKSDDTHAQVHDIINSDTTIEFAGSRQTQHAYVTYYSNEEKIFDYFFTLLNNVERSNKKN